MRLKRIYPQFVTIFFIFMGLVYVDPVHAAPSQNGSTGLILVPSAETLDAGNFSAGIWGNISRRDTGRYSLLPATITLGMGSFIEVYGSYPNLLFNREEDYADVSSDEGMILNDRKSADLGIKVRLYGRRTSNLKIAADATLQRRISSTPEREGVTDYGGRLISSYKTDLFGGHAYFGYMTRKLYDDEYIFGGALELSATPRTKIFTEITGNRFKENFSHEGQLEGDIGFQYFLSPYLCLSVSAGKSFVNTGPDWRLVLGLSTSTGLGAYIKPIPRLESELKAEAAKLVVIKPVKIIPISPKLVKTPAITESVSNIELPLDVDKEEVVIRSFGQIILPTQKNEKARPFIPPPLLDVSPDKEKTTRNEKDDQPPTYGFNVKGDSMVAPSPSVPKSDEKLVAYRRFRFPDVIGYFQQGQADLTAEAKKQLADLAEQIRNDKGWSYLRIDAYTDSVGSQKYNYDLSLRRAIQVASHLITTEGIDSSRIFVKGMGSSRQLADNQSESGRKMNRRFEILFLQSDVKQ